MRSATGHATVHDWKCAGREGGRQSTEVGVRGFIAELGISGNGVAMPTRGMT